MKKFIAVILTLVMLIPCFGIAAQARVGDVIGTALHTDIVVYINNYAIPSYAVNGQSVIVAEDLRNFGFDVIWDPYSRSLDIYRNWSITEPTPMIVTKGYTTGSKYTNILETDIGVWAGDRWITSYAMNGYTMIPVEELTMFGQVTWVQEERALKMWVDGLYINEEKQVISYKYYPGTSAPDFGWVTNSLCFYWETDWDGDLIRCYVADGADFQQYVNYIKKSGWVLDSNIQDENGIWYSGYINKKLRTGIAISELNGEVSVQIGTNMDYWEPAFEY